METKTENIKYNYYPIECVNIMNTDEEKRITIKSSYIGKINQPNISYNNHDNIEISYQATELSIYGKLHDIPGISQDGEIVILHSPATSAVKLYCCFPFAYKKGNATEVDDIIMSKTSKLYQDPPLTLELNKYINKIPFVREYNTKDRSGEPCLVIVFENIIFINSKLKRKQLDDELFIAGNFNSNIINFPYLSKPKTYSKAIIHEDIIRSPSFAYMNKGQEGMDNEGEIYSCEYLPVDSEDMVQVLQVPIGSPGYSTLVGSEVSNVFLNNAILMFMVILIFFCSPMIHHFIEDQLKKSETSTIFLKQICGLGIDFLKINLLNLMLVLWISITSFMLLLYGLSNSDRTSASIGIFLAFSGFISYLGISYFKLVNGIKPVDECKI